MGLFKDWNKLLESQTNDTFQEFWEEYSGAETKIYADILGRKADTVDGVLSELAAGYEVREIIFTGFLDGISTSLKNEINLEELDSDSQIHLEIDFEKLFFNMLKADADYLYTLKEWEDILSKEKMEEIVTAYRRSRTVVKEKKIGRNEPCPCGSGKKYKHCCGKNS